ncbi:LLM class flavin-dependent oxidoreductase [Rhodococcus sp. DMU1]|uniref:LLM class flavin-dependent oxidoreductase n=1 Tax=Rhodococcus sp. DMU1 TaxID=2722825 RepID=UPI0032B8312C
MNTAEMPAVAKMLDEAGFHGVLVSDHQIYPRELSAPYPATEDGKLFWHPDTEWPDAWVLIGAMAAVTENLRFGNNVYIAPSRPLLQVAKQVATAAALSEGRVSIGVSAGWMREEFELQAQQFENRGRRLNEMIEALRALWKGGWVS